MKVDTHIHLYDEKYEDEEYKDYDYDEEYNPIEEYSKQLIEASGFNCAGLQQVRGKHLTGTKK